MSEQLPLAMRLETGAALPAAVTKLASDKSISFCDFTGFGQLEWVSLAKDITDDPIYLKGPFHLLNLRGRLRMGGDTALVDMVCTLSRQTDNGIQVLGGQIVEAQVRFLELTITPLTLMDSDEIQPATGNAPAAPPRPDPSSQSRKQPSEAPAETKWMAAVKEAARIQRDSDFLDNEESDVRPKRGDIVRHAQFGECKVTRITDDHITLQKPDSRNVQLGLPILRFRREGRDGKKNVFRVDVKTKR